MDRKSGIFKRLFTTSGEGVEKGNWALDEGVNVISLFEKEFFECKKQRAFFVVFPFPVVSTGPFVVCSPKPEVQRDGEDEFWSVRWKCSLRRCGSPSRS